MPTTDAALPVTLYGIANCDSVKNARAWLAGQGVVVAFHDFKKAGVPGAALDNWLSQVGWQRLLNRQGSTWRKLPADQQAAVVDVPSARALMLAQPSVIKRPLLQWPGGGISVGWDAADAGQRLQRCRPAGPSLPSR